MFEASGFDLGVVQCHIISSAWSQEPHKDAEVTSRMGVKPNNCFPWFGRLKDRSSVN